MSSSSDSPTEMIGLFHRDLQVPVALQEVSLIR